MRVLKSNEEFLEVLAELAPPTRTSTTDPAWT
jgi:hypothetical protein